LDKLDEEDIERVKELRDVFGVRIQGEDKYFVISGENFTVVLQFSDEGLENLKESSFVMDEATVWAGCVL